MNCRSELLYLFQLCRNYKFLLLRVVSDIEHIRLAADLAVFHIRLRASGRFVHGRLVPFAAASTLKSCFHYASFSISRRPVANWKPETPIMATPGSSADHAPPDQVEAPCFQDAVFCRPGRIAAGAGCYRTSRHLSMREERPASAAVHRQSEIHEGSGEAHHGRKNGLQRQEKARQLMLANHLDAMLVDGRHIARLLRAECSGGEVSACSRWCLPAKGRALCMCPAFEEGRAREQLASSPEGKNCGRTHLAGGSESRTNLLAQGLKDLGISTGTLGMEETVRFVFSQRSRKGCAPIENRERNSGDRGMPHDQERP